MTVNVSELVLYLAAIVGAATTIITLLSHFIVPLRDLAKLTKITTDDEMVEKLNTWVHGALQVLLFLGKMIAPLALRSPTRVFPPSPVLGRPLAQTPVPATLRSRDVVPFGDDDDEETNYR